MPVNLALTDLMDYTNWERRKFHEWLVQRGDAVLKTSAGAHSDRFSTVGDIIKHIFSAEKRYVERLSGRPLTDPVGVPSDSAEALFELGIIYISPFSFFASYGHAFSRPLTSA